MKISLLSARCFTPRSLPSAASLRRALLLPRAGKH